MIFLNMHRFESYSNETLNTALDGRLYFEYVYCFLFFLFCFFVFFVFFLIQNIFLDVS